MPQDVRDSLKAAGVPKMHPLLTRANEIVNGPRRQDYGHPKDNHQLTAALWENYLNRRATSAQAVGGKFLLDAEDVCMLNILQKIARHAHSRTEDNRLDIVGWAVNADIVKGVTLDGR